MSTRSWSWTTGLSRRVFGATGKTHLSCTVNRSPALEREQEKQNGLVDLFGCPLSLRGKKSRQRTNRYFSIVLSRISRTSPCCEVNLATDSTSSVTTWKTPSDLTGMSPKGHGQSSNTVPSSVASRSTVASLWKTARISRTPPTVNHTIAGIPTPI